jgi:hypothetical protein
MLSNTAITNRRGGLNPPEPSVTTLGSNAYSECYRADSIRPYGYTKATFEIGFSDMYALSYRAGLKPAPTKNIKT